jgi:catechol-2,3-dioxygenase
MSSESTQNRGPQPISPARLSHAVLSTTRPNEMVKWYTTVLNAQVLYHNDFMSFMTYDDERHRIALVSFPGVVEKAKHSAGLDHLAFFYSTFEDWITTYERLKEVRITPRVSIHHGLTIFLYYRDPDDNGVELSIDNVEKTEWYDWMRNHLGDNPLGLPLDPDDLARKYHAGVPEAELRRFDLSSGHIDPEVPRRMIE